MQSRIDPPLRPVRPISLFLILLISISILPLPAPAHAQGTSGKIRGHIIDEGTGELLPIVHVQLFHPGGDSTGMGAVSNEEGLYLILNVLPGQYTLQASMMGYRTVQITELVVKAGITTNLDLQLESVILETGYVLTVTAESDPLQRDVTSSRDSYTSTQMQSMATYSTTDILSLQTNFYFERNFTHDIPGYYDRGIPQLHVRGGRNAEVAFMIDGMQVTNLVFGGQAVQTNPSALEEMVVMSSGMSAEFGNALSGVVNFVTRGGGPEYEGNIEILSSEISGYGQDDVRDMTRARGFVGGPVPLVPEVTFFLSGSTRTERDYLVLKDDIVYDLYVDPTDPSTRRPEIDYYQMPEDWSEFDPELHNPYAQRETDTDYNWRIYPADIYEGWLGYGFNNEWDILANLTTRFTPNMRLKLSLIRNHRFGAPYTSSWRYSMLWGIPEEIQENCIFGTERWNADQMSNARQNSRIIPSTGLTDFPNEKNVLYKDHNRFAFVWTHQPSRSMYYSIRASYLDYNRTMRVKRFINEDGYTARFEHLYPSGSSPRDTTWHRDDPMTQVTLEPLPYSASDDYDRRYGYFRIGGAGFGSDGSDRYFSSQFDITRTIKIDITNQVNPHHQIKTGLEYKALTIDQYDVQLLYLTPPYITQYRRGPVEFAFYLQDKIEYRHIVLNLGIRYDTSESGNVPFWLDPRNPMDEEGNLVIDPGDRETAPIKVGGSRREVSPRLGLSHPISESAVLYFNYGHFYQIPVYRNMYLQGTLEDSVPLIGNPLLESERSTKYEFGLRNHLDEIYALALVLWGKDTSNLVGSERIPAFFNGVSNPFDYTVFLNYDYSTARGMDISISRRFREYWSGRLNYSCLSTLSNRDDPWAGYRGGHELDTSPKRPRPVIWDQPHRFSANLDLRLPEGFGPFLAGSRILERISMSLLFRASAGRPYTPATRERALEPCSGRLPWTRQWDLRVYKDFKLLNLDVGLLAHVRNLTNRRNVTSVYTRTGTADDPGPGSTSYSENYDRSHYYGAPRTIDIGFRVRF